MNKKIILTGGSGLLALNWAYVMRQEAEICLFTHNHEVNMNDVISKKVELSNENKIEKALTEWKPDLVIHTAGLTNVDECERKVELANKVNADIAHRVAKVVHKLGSKLVHISTDHLFDGATPYVTEEATPCPMNIYA